MKKILVTALAAGLAFGLGIGVASAITGFDNTQQFLGNTLDYRLGYVAGVVDTINSFGDTDIDAANATTFARTASACVTNLTMNRGMLLGAMEAYLVSHMQTGLQGYVAAAVFIKTLSDCPY